MINSIDAIERSPRTEDYRRNEWKVMQNYPSWVRFRNQLFTIIEKTGYELFNRDKVFQLTTDLCFYGNSFWRVMEKTATRRPPWIMHRVETVQGKTLEYQESPRGVDYQLVQKPIEERWLPPAQDEDFFLPIRPGNSLFPIRYAPDEIVHAVYGKRILYGTSPLFHRGEWRITTLEKTSPFSYDMLIDHVVRAVKDGVNAILEKVG